MPDNVFSPGWGLIATHSISCDDREDRQCGLAANVNRKSVKLEKGESSLYKVAKSRLLAVTF